MKLIGQMTVKIWVSDDQWKKATDEQIDDLLNRADGVAEARLEALVEALDDELTDGGASASWEWD